MITKLIEVTNAEGGGGYNWGKVLVGRFTREEWSHRCAVAEMNPSSLLRACGWDASHILVLDLQTGEGAIFAPRGDAVHDLAKHRIWVCPMFEPLLVWLYAQDLTRLEALPDIVRLTEKEAPSAVAGYRRSGR